MSNWLVAGSIIARSSWNQLQNPLSLNCTSDPSGAVANAGAVATAAAAAMNAARRENADLNALSALLTDIPSRRAATPLHQADREIGQNPQRRRFRHGGGDHGQR